MFDFFKRLFKEGILRKLEKTVGEINALEPEIQKLSDEDLKSRSLGFKPKIQSGDSFDEVLPEAFALAREAAKRTLGQRPYDVQLLGGLVLHQGAIAEMVTGEGKTLAAVAPAYLNALSGKGVHVVTVNEYLARRDTVWMGQIYRALGLSVACLVPNSAFLYDPEFKIPKEGEVLIDKERDTTGAFLVQQEFLRPISRREAYLADITYGTNHEFGFDYLRDNLAYGLTDQVQRQQNFAIIDEVDSILIDEARTPLIIAAPDTESSDLYRTFARVAEHLEKEKDYAVDEKRKTASITEEGISKVEKMIGVQNLYAPENLRLVHYLEESLKAKALFELDRDYVVKNGEVLIVDEFTGRVLVGRRYSGGLHQAIEAKEGVEVQQESKTYARISIQNYFRLYKKIAGMTGTAQTSAEEFHKVYNLESATIPTNRPLIRKNFQDVVYKNFDAKIGAIVKDIKEKQKQGQPVLIGTTSIEKNEYLSRKLAEAGIQHEILNAKQNEREGAIIAQAGRAGAVTVATNMAGRGVDIILGGNPPNPEEAEKVKSLGGLHVVGTERHEARRIDDQLRGRCGRQGDPGSSQFYLSFEDDLMRIFGGDRVKNIMERLDVPDDQPIQLNFVSKTVAQAQAKVEGMNFDLRKHLLEYDDVLNKQRTAVYLRRQEILESFNKKELAKIIFEAVKGQLDWLLANGYSFDTRIHAEQTQMDADTVKEGELSLKKVFQEVGILNPKPQTLVASSEWPKEPTPEKIEELLLKKSEAISAEPQALGKTLAILDMLWMNHLEDLEALMESIGLRAYGQKDPLVEYRREAHRLFKDFWNNFNGWLFANIFKSVDQNASGSSRKAAPSGQSVDSGNKVGRNDPCPCGSGKKYKKCHGA